MFLEEVCVVVIRLCVQRWTVLTSSTAAVGQPAVFTSCTRTENRWMCTVTWQQGAGGGW